MTKLKNKINSKILTIILISYFIIPFIGTQLVNSSSNNLNNESNINLDSLTSSFATEVNSNPIVQEDSSSFQNLKYDRDLNELLVDLIKNQESNPKNIDVIISFDDSLSKDERINVLNLVFDDYQLKDNYDLISSVHVEINPNQLIVKNKLIEGIKTIKEIHESKFYQLPYIKNDSLQLSALDSQDYLNWWLPAIGAEDLPYNGSGVKVAVVDTGIYPHPDLNIINNRNFVSEEDPSSFNDITGHGTHAAGIIAGDGGGSSGEYRGVAPGALLINARAGNESGLGEADIISAIEWSSKPESLGGAGADIVSMSFGGGYPIISDNITKTISTAQNDYGVVFVASAGNSGPAYFTGSTPAAGIDVISVGATDRNDDLASFSSWGPTFGYIGYPDVVAPGVNIISTEAKDSTFSMEERYKGDYFDFSGDADYIPLSGTSFSCPMVAGAVAVLLDAYPYITPETARIALIEGARTLPNENDDDLLKSGAGIINVTASLNYLESIAPDYNDTAKIYPDNLPVKPYDLLHFPGDHQKFNLTLISGTSNTYDIEIPDNIQGVSISTDKTNISFSEAGIGFIELEIYIEKNAFAEIKEFHINLTSGMQLYDTVNVKLDIRLPEYRTLMDSYHGLNDWFADPYIGSTFYQMGFYEAMSDLSELNISVDYGMEYWISDYNRDTDNTLLTEERLAQYDIIVLQNPILPYSPEEIDNIENYFESGGNLLFLGTRYQDMDVENVNYLFSRLNVDIQINEENIIDDDWVGLGVSVSSQSVYDLNNPTIFNNVSQFYWLYGNSFTVSNKGDSIATIDNKTVAALYNGTELGKGNFLAFGDLHWMYEQYDSASYTLDHSNLLKNVVDFLLPKEDVSITIDLGKESSSNSIIDLSVYLKNQTSEEPITDADSPSFSVMIKNNTYQKSIILNTTNASEGIYFNNSFNVPFPSSNPYTIIVNLTIGLKEFSRTTKILYYDVNEMPVINDITFNDSPITRANGQSKFIVVTLNGPLYNDFDGYLSIYSYSFYNMKKSVNKTLTFSHLLGSDYSENFFPQETDPAGYAIFYLVPKDSNYTVSNSPRALFQIRNNPPEILLESSRFNYDYFSATQTDKYHNFYSTTQGDLLNFAVDVTDTVTYEDADSAMRVFVNLLIFILKEDGSSLAIIPNTLVVSELNYLSGSGKFEGNFTIPSTMQYSTLSGIKSISTASNVDRTTNRGYIGVLSITAYDREGGADDFIIVLLISKQPMNFTSIVIIVFIIIGIIGFASMLIYFTRRRKRPRTSEYQPRYQYYDYEPSYERSEQEYVTPEPLSHLGQFYCPFCGHLVAQPKKFCPNCGKSLEFSGENE